MRQMKITHNELAEIVKQFKKTKDNRLIIGVKINKSKTDYKIGLVAERDAKAFDGVIVCNVSVDEMIELLKGYTFFNGFRGYKPNAKSNKDWYASDNYYFGRVVYDIVNPRLEQLWESNRPRTAPLPVTPKDVKDDVLNEILKNIQEDPDLPKYPSSVAAREFLECVELTYVGKTVQQDWVNDIVVFSGTDEIAGSMADYLASAVSNGCNGYRVSLTNTPTTHEYLYKINKNIHRSALNTDKMLRILKHIVDKFGIDYKIRTRGIDFMG